MELYDYSAVPLRVRLLSDVLILISLKALRVYHKSFCCLNACPTGSSVFDQKFVFKFIWKKSRQFFLWVDNAATSNVYNVLFGGMADCMTSRAIMLGWIKQSTRLIVDYRATSRGNHERSYSKSRKPTIDRMTQ